MSQPKVFISYSFESKDWARKFAEALTERDINVWLDEWKLKPGDSWVDALDAALRESDAIVPIISQSNVRSPNTLFELGVAVGSGKRLIPVLDRDLEDGDIPFDLRARQSVARDSPVEAAAKVAEAIRADAPGPV